MFGGDIYYHEITKKMVIVFGSIFNSITINRTDTSNNVTQTIKVPIEFAPKEKFLTRLQQDPNLDKQAATILPRMAFEMIDIYPDRSRKLPSTNKMARKYTGEPDKLKYQYTAVPYDIKFALYIYVKNTEDGTRIIEQILPFFTPDWTASVELIPDMTEVRDIPFILENIGMQDLYDGDFKSRRVLIWTLNFTCHTYMYGPIKDKPIIKFANTTVLIPPGNNTANAAYANTNYTDIIETITMQPGLLANGSPTTNVAASVDWHLINIDDDFGFASTKE